MTTAEALRVLIAHNKWRRFAADEHTQPLPMQNPRIVGEAIDVAINVLNRTHTATLTVAQLRAAVEICGPDENDQDQQEACVTLFFRDKDETSADGEPLPRGWYCFETEYPEHGCHELGPSDGFR